MNQEKRWVTIFQKVIKIAALVLIMIGIYVPFVIADDIIFDVPSSCVIGTDLIVSGTSTRGNTLDIAIDDIMTATDIPLDAKGEFIIKFSTGRGTILNLPGTYRIKAYIDGPKDRNDNPVELKTGEQIPENLGIVDDGSSKVMMVQPTLTAQQTTDFVSQGNLYSVSGNAPGSKYVDVAIISSKGSYGVGIDGGYGISIYQLPVSTIDYSFSVTINVSQNADNGRYIALVLSPGRDEFYGYGENEDLTISELVASDVFDLKTQYEILNILEHATARAAGSDDLLQEYSFIVGHEIPEFKPPETSLTVDESLNRVALGDAYRISGTCYGSSYVNIVTVSPKGAAGNATDGTKPGYIIYSLPLENQHFSKRIPIAKNTDKGFHIIIVLSPGRNGIYDGIGTSDFEKGLNDKYNLTYNINSKRERSEEEIIAIIQDTIVATPGSDDLIKYLQLKIESPCIELCSIPDVQIGDEVEISGVTNREDETVIKVEVEGQAELPVQLVQVKNGSFTAKFDTSGAVIGSYLVSAEDGDGHEDRVTLVIQSAFPKPTPAPVSSTSTGPTSKPRIQGFEAVMFFLAFIVVANLLRK
jgi:hypothetical protein